MRRFNLVRSVDLSGVSGVGTVAEGVEFSNGSCCLTWLSDLFCHAFYKDIETVELIHGHEGRTVVVFID